MYEIVFKMQVANLYFDYYVAFIDKMSAPKMSYKKLHSVNIIICVLKILSNIWEYK